MTTTTVTQPVTPPLPPPGSASRALMPVETIAWYLRLLFDRPGDVFEIRAPKSTERHSSSYQATTSGYYTHDSIQQAAGDIAKADSACRAPGWYVTLNPVEPALLARCANQMKFKALATTTDAQIRCRRWMLVDVDPVRASETSSSDDELEAARVIADRIRTDLCRQHGWPEPIVCMSGNGWHLLYRLADLPADDGGLVQRVLTALSDEYGTEAVSVDRSVHNPARIIKIAGTMSRKGSDLRGHVGIEDRPHRRAEIVHVPQSIVPAATEALEAFVALHVPSAAPAATRANVANHEADDCGPFDCSVPGVCAWLESHGIAIKAERSKGDHTLLCLERCPINPEIESTSNSDIAVMVHNDGMLAYCNKHNRGQDYTWHDLRSAIEPDYEPVPEMCPEVDLSRFEPGSANNLHNLHPEGPQSSNFVSQPALLIEGGTARFPDDDDTGGGSTNVTVHDPGPFPEHLLRVPGLIGEVMAHNLATATRPQPVLALAGALCLQSVLAARKVRDVRGNRTNVYAIGIAPSGGGKEHARKINRNVLFQAGLDEFEGSEDLASDAGLISAVEQQPGILFQIDEIGRFLRTIGDPKRSPHLFNVLTVLMKLYSSADTSFRGKAYADAKKNRAVDQPCVSLYGTSVPEHFYQSLTTDSVNDGFVARLLVFEAGETNPPRSRAVECAIPEAIVEMAQYWGEFKPGGNLRSEHPDPLVIDCAEEAEAIFDSLAVLVDEQMNRQDLEGRALWARAEEKACRLALIYACSANPQGPVIDAEAARWACDLSTYLTQRTLHVASQWVSEGHFDARQKKMLRILAHAGGSLDRRSLWFKTRSMTVRERDEILQNLIITGQVETDSVKTKGRPKTVIRLAMPVQSGIEPEEGDGNEIE